VASVRSLTFFLPIKEYRDDYHEDIEEYMESIDSILNGIDFKPWTYRVVLPPIPRQLKTDILESNIEEILNLFDKRWIFNLLPIYASSRTLSHVSKLLLKYDRVYCSILYEHDYLDRLINEIYMKEIDPDIYTRIAISFKGWITTPYFPCTANYKNIFGFAVSLRYTDLFDRCLKGDMAILVEYFNKLIDQIGTHKDFLGIDYSLSPWMEESVARVIENNFGITLGGIGSYNAIYNSNLKIREIIKSIRCPSIGFNEIMLAVGEDNVLKERVDEGYIRLCDLVGLSSVCVAGLDMVGIRRDKRLIRNLILDLHSIANIKDSVIGMRILPSDTDVIYSKRFGRIPIIQLC
jgi:hypothetical protein